MRLALIGSKAIGLGAYRALREYASVRVVTLNDSHDSRSRLDDFRELGATVVSKSEANAAIRSLDADLIVVAGWYWRIEGTDERRFVGIHHSLLPKFRGGSPLVWALIRGEAVGTSLFTLTDGMDDGPVWARAEVKTGSGYIGEVQEACDRAAIRLLPELFRAPHPTPQLKSEATWCAQRRPEDGMIDWTQPAESVVRWIRAQSRPYPGAFTYQGERKVTIWRASISSMGYVGTPGQVVGTKVICGDDRAIEVEESSELLSGRVGRPSYAYGRVA